MKFLIALSVLASATAFADEHRYIKCWDTAQEEGGRPAYVFKTEHEAENFNGDIGLVYPYEFDLRTHDHCLVSEHHPSSVVDNGKFRICPTQGQSINGLVPFEVEERFFEGTVYCEKQLKRFFYDRGPVIGE